MNETPGRGRMAGKPLYVLGIAAMDRKARSKPMRNILNRVMSYGDFEITIFGDKVILDEDIEAWPTCDFLISFFSTGFPLEKAIAYVQLRKPFCINDLPMQKLLWDRRLVLAVLENVAVPTPPRVEVHRDGGPRVDEAVRKDIKARLGFSIGDYKPDSVIELINDRDAIKVDGKTLAKPFVEKPVSGEDHDINIYYSKKQGSGGRRLFRKVGNKSSEKDPALIEPRTEGSYVYEQFMDVDNAEDVKVYTIGPKFTHAETRKSPVVDGLVRRNTEGKEIRFITSLTAAEQAMAAKISTAFKQTICGFDLLRVDGKSYIIDVNGWSFVKGNDYYYDKCAEILVDICRKAYYDRASGNPYAAIHSSYLQQRDHSVHNSATTWKVKAVITVFRHADRTPKQKIKFNFRSAPFVALLGGRREEIILRKVEQLRYVEQATREALKEKLEDEDKVSHLLFILDKKIDLPGTKAQVKPSYSKTTGELEKLQVILKWGGEFTHAARHQSRDLGENLKKDMTIMNREILDNCKIYTSSERRVSATAELVAGAFLEGSHQSEQSMPIDEGDQVFSPPKADPSPVTVDNKVLFHIRKDLLDDSNSAKAEMDQVKKKLKTLLRPGHANRPEFPWPKDMPEPAQVVREIRDLMTEHREIMHRNWELLDVEKIQKRWCCNEHPTLFRERWEKLFEDFCGTDPEKFDPSRISELYDSMKYDALHNRVFFERIFDPATSKTSKIPESPSNGPGKDVQPTKLGTLYKSAKSLFDLVAPQEYGIEDSEKLEIGLLTSAPLLRKVVEDLENVKASDIPSSRLYFTKESHIHTLLNCILLSGLPIEIPRVNIPELDYMSNINFELYERKKDGRKEFSVRIMLTEGAHSPNLLDMQLDARHVINVAPRRQLMKHQTLERVIEAFRKHLDRVKIKSLTPLAGDEVYVTPPVDETVRGELIEASAPAGVAWSNSSANGGLTSGSEEG